MPRNLIAWEHVETGVKILLSDGSEDLIHANYGPGYWYRVWIEMQKRAITDTNKVLPWNLIDKYTREWKEYL